MGSGGGERRFGNGGKTSGECSMGKLEEVQLGAVERRKKRCA